MSSASDLNIEVLWLDSELNARWRNVQREVSVVAGLADLHLECVPSPWDLTATFQKLEETRNSE